MMNAIAHASAPVSGPKLDNRRLLAALVDLLVVAAGGAAILQVAGAFPPDGLKPGLIGLVAAWALYYYFACESGGGQTVGKRLMKLRVVLADGRPAGMRDVAVRTVLRVLDTPLVGLIVMMATGERRARLGDLAAGTMVVDAGTAPGARPAAAVTVAAVAPPAPDADASQETFAEPDADEPEAMPAPEFATPAEFAAAPEFAAPPVADVPAPEPPPVPEQARFTPFEEAVVEPAPVDLTPALPDPPAPAAPALPHLTTPTLAELALDVAAAAGGAAQAEPEPVVEIVEPEPLYDDEPVVEIVEPEPLYDDEPVVEIVEPEPLYDEPVADPAAAEPAEEAVPDAEEEDEGVTVKSVQTMSAMEHLMGEMNDTPEAPQD